MELDLQWMTNVEYEPQCTNVTRNFYIWTSVLLTPLITLGLVGLQTMFMLHHFKMWAQRNYSTQLNEFLNVYRLPAGTLVTMVYNGCVIG